MVSPILFETKRIKTPSNSHPNQSLSPRCESEGRTTEPSELKQPHPKKETEMINISLRTGREEGNENLADRGLVAGRRHYFKGCKAFSRDGRTGGGRRSKRKRKEKENVVDQNQDDPSPPRVVLHYPIHSLVELHSTIWAIPFRGSTGHFRQPHAVQVEPFAVALVCC